MANRRSHIWAQRVLAAASVVAAATGVGLIVAHGVAALRAEGAPSGNAAIERVGVLDPGGIGTTRFGAPAPAVGGGLERLLGSPSSESLHGPRDGLSAAGCGFAEIVWTGLAEVPGGSHSAGLTAYFRRSRFVGYAYGPPYGGPRAPVVRDGVMLSTAQGLGLDDAVSRARELYGGRFRVGLHAHGTPANRRLERLAVWSARVGHGRLYGFVDSPGGPGSTAHRTIASISAGEVPNTPCR